MLGPGAKNAAKDERDKWRRLQTDASLAGGLISAAVTAAVVGVTGAVAFPPLVVVGLMTWWAQRKLIVIERKVEDPPRLDFDKPTVVTPHPVHPEGFATNPLEQIALQFFRDLSASVALEEAMITADERQEGARLLQRTDEAERRADEVRGFMESLWVRNQSLNQIGIELGNRLRAHQLLALSVPWLTLDARTPVADAMPPEVMARLFRAGIDVNGLADPVMSAPIPAGTAQPPDPMNGLASALSEATSASVAFATTARSEITAP